MAKNGNQLQHATKKTVYISVLFVAFQGMWLLQYEIVAISTAKCVNNSIINMTVAGLFFLELFFLFHFEYNAVYEPYGLRPNENSEIYRKCREEIKRNREK